MFVDFPSLTSVCNFYVYYPDVLIATQNNFNCQIIYCGNDIIQLSSRYKTHKIIMYNCIPNIYFDFFRTVLRKGGYTLVTLSHIVIPYRNSVYETRARVTYQKLVTR
jgi:hypothetical protein